VPLGPGLDCHCRVVMRDDLEGSMFGLSFRSADYLRAKYGSRAISARTFGSGSVPR
jgi:hypothetical protein